MAECYHSIGEIKRKVRNLKKLEIKIRYHVMDFKDCRMEMLSKSNKIHLVWNEFFDLHEPPSKEVKYSVNQLGKMQKEELENVISEFFYGVYYRFYMENGILAEGLYAPELLSQIGLPFDADSNAVKKRFRELAKKYHPDTGGDSAKFIELMEQFEAFRKAKI
jgi:hypothetical protein